jgi:ribonuclease HI
MIAYIDGLCEPVNPNGIATYGYVIFDDSMKEIKSGCRVIGEGAGMTNNVAEYSALLRVLEWLRENCSEQEIVIHSDSQLVVNQMSGSWAVRAPLIIPLWRKAMSLQRGMKISYAWIPREENEKADMLSWVAYRRHLMKKGAVLHG